MRYQFQAVVERNVLDTIFITVETEGDFEEALRQTRKALAKYPDLVDGTAVRSMYTENRENLKTEVKHIERIVSTHDD